MIIRNIYYSKFSKEGSMMIFGMICAATLWINIGAVRIGEILIIFIGIINIIKMKKINFDSHFKLYVVMTSMFIGYTALYFIFNINNKEYIIKNVFKYFDMLLITVSAYFLLKKDEKKFMKFILAFSVTQVVVNLLMGQNYSNISLKVHYLSYLLPILWFMLFFKEKKWVIMVLYTVLIILTIIGKSRTNLVIIFMTIAYKFYQNLLHGNKSKINLIKGIFIIIILAISCGYAYNYFLNNLSQQTESNSERKLLLEIAINEIKENLLIGVGPGNYNYYAEMNYGVRFRSNDMKPHNFYLEIFSEWGIIGFSLYIIPLIALLINLVKKNEENTINKNIYFYYFLYLLFNVLSGVTRANIAIVLAYMIYDYSKSKKEAGLNEKCDNSIKLQ